MSKFKLLMILLKSIVAKDYDNCFKQGSLFDNLSTENCESKHSIIVHIYDIIEAFHRFLGV